MSNILQFSHQFPCMFTELWDQLFLKSFWDCFNPRGQCLEWWIKFSRQFQQKLWISDGLLWRVWKNKHLLKTWWWLSRIFDKRSNFKNRNFILEFWLQKLHLRFDHHLWLATFRKVGNKLVSFQRAKLWYASHCAKFYPFITEFNLFKFWNIYLYPIFTSLT